jgi:hypothetical protein
MKKRNVIDFSIVLVFIACCVTMLVKGVGNKGAAIFMLSIGIVGLFWMITDVFKKRN